jgi:hypothetical protein
MAHTAPDLASTARDLADAASTSRSTEPNITLPIATHDAPRAAEEEQ